MRTIFAVWFAVILTDLSPATAAGGFFGFCGPGCHATVRSMCVVDGWGRGATVSNECPVTTRPRPPCPPGYVWSRSFQACKLTVRDWVGGSY
jgi:hypothetical protein